MPAKKKLHDESSINIEKVPTGIDGFDQITNGGIPKGRPTLICGNAGCGKTLMAMEMLIHGALEFNEPGVFIAFEETREDLIKNVRSLGFDLKEMERKKQIAVDYIFIEPNEIAETGDYDLEGLFIRIGHAIKKINAKRVVIDTLEVLFSGFKNENILRAEIRRLFNWFRSQNISVIVTGEKGEGQSLTRHGLEEFVADCVIYLDHRIVDQLSTRRIRIIKYRGALHGTDEYPFLITKKGISILPINLLGLKHVASKKQISTGIARLDNMLDGKGYYKGSTVIFSGTSGAGKTSFVSAFAEGLYKKKQRCLYFTEEESVEQIVRNMSSIGINFRKAIDDGYLKIISSRPSNYGLEARLINYMAEIEDFKPEGVVLDPISGLIGQESQIYSMLTRIIDFIKLKQITLLMTYLHADNSKDTSILGMSSIVDTWIMLRNTEYGGERNREMFVIKSRGMNHSNQVREFFLSSKGIDIADVYIGEGRVLTGSERILHEQKEFIENKERELRLLQNKEEINLTKKIIKSKMEALAAEIETKELTNQLEEELFRFKSNAQNLRIQSLTKSRSADQKHFKKKEKK